MMTETLQAQIASAEADREEFDRDRDAARNKMEQLEERLKSKSAKVVSPSLFQICML